MRLKQKITSLLLALSLVAGLVPGLTVTAQAAGTDKTIMAGVSGISGPETKNDDSGNYYTPSDYIWYGAYDQNSDGTAEPIQWRVLSTSGNATGTSDSLSDGTNTVTNDNALFLLSEYLLGSGVYFQQNYHYDSSDGVYRKGSTHSDNNDEALANAWQESDAQTWAKDFAGESGSSVSDAFTSGEQAALLATTKEDASTSKYSLSWGASKLEGDKVFFLSVDELSQYVGSYDYAPGLKATPAGSPSAGVWWLRSPDSYSSNHAGVVSGSGGVSLDIVCYGRAVRPAFNLNLNSVLFTSAAEGGKSSMTSGLQQVTDYTDSGTKGWKVTLAESDKSITGTGSGIKDSQQNTVTSLKLTAGYSGAQKLTVTHKSLSSISNDYTNITATLTNGSGEIFYYGSINTDTSATTSTVTIPEGLSADTYTLSIRGEDWNSDKQTDYATGDAITATIEVKLEKLSQPTATFTAGSSDSGTLSSVASGMEYGIGMNDTEPSEWQQISATTATVSGLTGSSVIWIINKGDNVTTANSDPQKITVTKAATPTGLNATGCTTASNNDGKISGFTSGTTYEYKKEGDEVYQDVSGTELTGLASGSYYVRVKASGTVLASEYVTVSVPAVSETMLTGTVTISGTAKYGETLTASLSDSNNTGTLSYQWLRGENQISGATQASYTVVAEDVGSTLYCKITSSAQGGEVSGNIGLVDKADGPVVPSGLSGVMPTASSTNDGKITGVTTDMEYDTGTNFENAQDCAGTEITGLAPGTYYVRLKATATHHAGEYATVVVPQYAEYAVSVVGSEAQTTGEGSYAQGATVSIDAGTKSGYIFAGWTSESGVRFAEASSAQTTFEMPGKAVTVTANWTKNSSGDGGGTTTYSITLPDKTEGGEVTSSRRYAGKGDAVTLTVTPEDGYTLSSLTVKDSRGNELALTDRGEGKYSFTMPASKVTVEAAFAKENPSTGGLPFTDVKANDWFYDSVKYVYEQGLMAGTSTTTFSPEAEITRGMIVTILWRQAGAPDMEDEIWGYPYADVDAEAYYGTAVYWARLNGIASGYGNNEFGPTDPITREQLAVILWRYAGSPAASGSLAGYTDAGSVSGYAVDALRWAVSEGIVSGTSSATLSPQGSATRAQAAAMLQRYLERIG